MGIRAEHEIHTRRRGRNLGVGLLLAAFVVLVMALTFVKITNIDFNDLPGGALQTQESN
ncbi:cytochrome C oxidase assembly protein [Sulfitobacter sp. M39]|uniref:cytochrome C oxidase assembly protein n=1 Tax=Sulfitobacter sp. M39 TaxID=2675334 RepID=UPI001F1ACAE7|nr:cytochrome C oxidase assembly protein [Sulfitobacter sp. M39]MCF7746958.1 cytochrome C oxidase assembly protein [Sulfitobacter sp. M39]